MASLRFDSSPPFSTRTPTTPPAEAAHEPGTALGRFLARQFARLLGDVPVEIRLPDGTRHVPTGRPPTASITIKDLRIVPALLRGADVAFGEAYEAGLVDVDGDLVAFLEALWRRNLRAEGVGRRTLRARVRKRNTRASARRNIHHHYDLGNDFYRLWLDRELVYTCAYYPSPDDSLEAAQLAKMELICRKLCLRPGERVIEAGCGWGALALYMARHHGVLVRAYNISGEQVRYARDRAKREGLISRVEFVDDDYRNIRGPVDVFVSIGMLEHVGPSDYGTLGEIIHRALPEGRGRGLLHFIGRNRPAPMSRWIDRRIFPGAYPPSLTEMMRGVLEPHAFSVLDVENLRLHYARTLRHWLERFEREAGTVTRMFGDRFVRAWRLYLAGSQAAFLAGSLQLFQVVFARGEDNHIPWTRSGGGAFGGAPAGPHGTA